MKLEQKFKKDFPDVPRVKPVIDFWISEMDDLLDNVLIEMRKGKSAGVTVGLLRKRLRD